LGKGEIRRHWAGLARPGGVGVIYMHIGSDMTMARSSASPEDGSACTSIGFPYKTRIH